VVKPLQSAGSEDVYLCNSRAEAEAAFSRILGKVDGLGDRNESVLVQEFLVGKEYVVDQVSRDGVHKVVAVWEYDKRPANGSPFVYFGRRLLRSDLPHVRAMIAYGGRVLDALGIRHGPSHMEIIYQSDDGVCAGGGDSELSMQDGLVAGSGSGSGSGSIVGGPCLVEVGARCHGGEGQWLPVAEECIGYSQVRTV
jgi:biotin carboxylase